VQTAKSELLLTLRHAWVLPLKELQTTELRSQPHLEESRRALRIVRSPVHTAKSELLLTLRHAWVLPLKELRTTEPTTSGIHPCLALCIVKTVFALLVPLHFPASDSKMYQLRVLDCHSEVWGQ
jgi:hypothetical protein